MFRDDYHKTCSSDFIYSIPIQLKNITAISLTSLDIPNSWYLFSQKKPTLRLSTFLNFIKLIRSNKKFFNLVVIFFIIN